MHHSEWPLALMAIMLGIRHGFDLDHLATIDAMTRTVSRQARLSRWVGVIFSLGHGLVVIAVSMLVASGFLSRVMPEWLMGLGQGISLFFLVFFGLLTLYRVFRPEVRHHWMPRLLGADIPLWMIFIIGMLFAFSFDTLSQAALFSLSGSQGSGLHFAGVLGFLFMLGMMVADGLNGAVVSFLVTRTQRSSLILSRVLGLLIAVFSLGLALYNGLTHA